MAQVRYQPEAAVAPTLGGTPYVSENAPPGAFGASVAGATQRLGAQEEQAGDKVFQAGIQAEEFNQQRDVKNALFNDVTPEMDKRFADYMTLTGEAADKGYGPFIDGMKQLISEKAQKFTSPYAQNAFLDNARYLYQRIDLSASTHAAQQRRESWISTNRSANENLTNESAFMQNDVQLLKRNGLQIQSNAEANALHSGLSPEDTKAHVANEVGKYWMRVIQAKLYAPIGQGGGARSAQAVFDQAHEYMDATTADGVSRMLHPYIKQQEGQEFLGQALRDSGYAPESGPGGSYHYTGPAVSADTMNAALWNQESGGRPTSETSSAGALGGHQIMPATFQRYAQPGEQINNPKDNAVVGARIVSDLTRKYAGDPARVATAYFSGEANVAPVGSETPWLEDKKDTNGKSVSSYVSDVLKRVSGTQGQPAGGAAAAQAGAPGWRMPDWSKVEERVLQIPDEEARAAAQTQLSQLRQRIDMATATSRADLRSSLGDTVKAAEAGLPINLNEDQVRGAFPPDEADRYIAQVRVAEGAGQVMAGLKWASPEQLNQAVIDLSPGGAIATRIAAQLGRIGAQGAKVTTPAAPGQPTTSPESSIAFGMRTQIADRALQLIRARQEALRDDPSGYAVHEPSVAMAAQGMDPKRPETFANYANATLGIQEHLGVRPEAQRVLNRQQADAIVQDLMQPGGDTKQKLDGLAAQWGGAWQHVYSDLVTLGKMPAEMQGVAALDDPKDAALLARAIQEKTKSGKEWDDLLGKTAGGPPVAQDIRNTIRNDPVMQQMERSWGASGATIGEISTMRGAVETLAYAKRFYSNDGSAAQNAVKAFTDRYRFLPNGGARLPAAQADVIEHNAGVTLNGLTMAQIDVPRGFRAEDTEEAKRLNPLAPSASDYLTNLKANPMWITSPKGDALWLLDNGARVVRDRAGNPVSVPFAASAMPLPQGMQESLPASQMVQPMVPGGT